MKITLLITIFVFFISSPSIAGHFNPANHDNQRLYNQRKNTLLLRAIVTQEIVIIRQLLTIRLQHQLRRKSVVRSRIPPRQG